MNKTQKNTVDSVSGLLEIIKKEREQLCASKEIFFRGQVANFGEIKPSISRFEYLNSEDIIFKEFILRNPNDFQGLKTTFEKLAKMQHYSLPTRLLDISSNPLISLFFAVEEQNNSDDEKDGLFVIYNIPESHIKYYDSDTVSVVANVARRPVDKLDISKLSHKLSDFNGSTDIQYLLHEIKEEKPYFKDYIIKEHLQSIWCVKPLLNNRRLIKQDGAFLLFGITGDKSKLADYNPEEFIPNLYVIPSNAKKLIREELEILGITRDKIYPELDTTAQYLKEKYKKR